MLNYELRISLDQELIRTLVNSDDFIPIISPSFLGISSLIGVVWNVW